MTHARARCEFASRFFEKRQSIQSGPTTKEGEANFHKFGAFWAVTRSTALPAVRFWQMNNDVLSARYRNILLGARPNNIKSKVLLSQAFEAISDLN